MLAEHEGFLTHCLELARKGLGWVSPNPLVGSVIVHSGKIIGEGYHRQWGGPHAEVHAIESVEDRSLLSSSTLYVNLEPCSHFGKTPPCADLILESKIPRVVVGTFDPFPEVSGRGIERLRSHGVEVTIGVLEKECRELNRRFFTLQEQHRPYVILKWAQTADGFIARADGSSKWISSEESRALVHRWRAEEQAIMVGTNTAVIDDPLLTARIPGARQPLRIVLDREAKIPAAAKVFNDDAPTLIISERESHPSAREVLRMAFTPSLIAELMTQLAARKIQSLFVEGGGALHRSFIESGLWDEARVFTAPQRFGSGVAAPVIASQARATETVGGDRLLWYRNAGSAELQCQVSVDPLHI